MIVNKISFCLIIVTFKIFALFVLILTKVDSLHAQQSTQEGERPISQSPTRLLPQYGRLEPVSISVISKMQEFLFFYLFTH